MNQEYITPKLLRSLDSWKPINVFKNILAVYSERFFHKESLLRLLAIREILNERKNVLKSVKQAKKKLIPGEQCALNIAPVEHEYRVSRWSSRMWFHILISTVQYSMFKMSKHSNKHP